MPHRSEEAAAFFAAAYAAIQEIPHGKVTSYAHIARLIGRRESLNQIYHHYLDSDLKPAECPRQVGVCLKHLPDDPTQRFNNDTVPWQRVVNAKGGISPRGPGSTTRQATALRREGVQVDRSAMGEYSVDFSTYGWFPEMLPSEEAELEAEASDDEDDPSVKSEPAD
jgi:methylated-DNA-protein-cysteine methyltransferase-like protein